MNSPSGATEFRELDALLEQAYALDDEARKLFVDNLPESQRLRIRNLLDLSNELTMSNIVADAQAVIQNAEHGRAQADTDEGSHQENDSAAPGRWRLHKELGAGGMGQVFYATRKAAAGTVDDPSDYVQEAAIKILWSQRATPEVRARFLRERRILASLDHPGLARFVDGGFLADSRPWFAMEFVAGKNIDEYAASLPLAIRLSLFIEVCASVAYAHQRLVVHRDIKPQNVLVDQSGRARLLDFGVAGVLDQIDDGVHTRTSGAPLTLQYASPEQVSGEMVTVASDVYQLGMLLYKLVTGVVPYDLTDVPLKEALQTICERTPPNPSSRNPKIAADLDAIVLTALNKNPEVRYRTATALAEDIGRFVDGHPVRAVPPTKFYIARRFLKRHAVIAGVVAASALALAAATAVSIRMANEASQEAARTATAQQILSDVFQKADPFAGQGATVTLADALMRAQPDIAARVADDPLLAWEVNRALGQIYESLGLVEQEMAAYRGVLAATDALGESGGNRYLTGVAGLGSVLARTNPVDAVKFFDARLPARPDSEDELDSWLSAQYSYVGALNRVREYGRADTGTIAMVNVMEEYDVVDARKRGRLSQLLASAARRAGDSEAENRHWKNTVEYMRHANNASALAVTLNNWAIHLGRLKRYDESEAAFLEAMAIFESAGLQDPTFASVMRGYAGLLFRTGRIDEAIATSERSLALLAPTSQFYARFVGELNLVRYSFVKGDIAKTLATLTRSLPAAQSAFADDPTVPRRMLGSFAKVMVFGRTNSAAATALGHEIHECSNESQLFQVLEALEHPDDRPVRNTIWATLRELRLKSETDTLAQSDVDEFLEFYIRTAPPFFDALDQWRVLDQLASLPARVALPAEQARQYQALNTERLNAESFISTRYPSVIADLADYFGETADLENHCP